ncbi:transmembrane protein 184C-like [Sitophilus oryzae]|uniref:Transmembrane protein 184C-like n=1 Tax=Sitophilus oryzae TaxID=7048 RepID=A0A6J2XN14_SITOR|nr:transmembrane protein 184C-like [Sitophilus oryzae]
MCLAAIAHHYSFSFQPYIRPGTRQQSCCSAFLAMWDISDVHRDIQEHIGIVRSSISRRIRGRSMYSIPRGTDEFSNLVSPRGGQSVPASFYQSEYDDFVVNYGTVTSSQPVQIHNTDPGPKPI